MATPPDTPEAPLRRDAERNRRRILEAAGELFAERGLAVTLDDIARHAGVGVGTVYRRFPDKEQLIDALFEERLARVAQVARDAHALADPWEGIRGFLEGVLEHMSEDRGIKELLLSTEHGLTRVERLRAELMPLLADVLERAKAAGAVRNDLAVTDLALLQYAVSEVDTWLHPVDPTAWRRLLTIVLDGLRPTRDAATAMTVQPLPYEALGTAMCRYRPRIR